jgi:integrase
MPKSTNTPERTITVQTPSFSAVSQPDPAVETPPVRQPAPTGAAAIPGLPADVAAAAASIAHHGTPANTTASYKSAARYLSTWYTARYASAPTLPWSAAEVVTFITDHVPVGEGTSQTTMPPAVQDVMRALSRRTSPTDEPPPAHRISIATLDHRLSALSAAHERANLPNPTRVPPVRQLLKHARAIAARSGKTSRRATPLTAPLVNKMASTCDDSTIGIRDRALLLFAFASGGRRRSEISTALFSNLKKIGAQHYNYHLAVSKTNQAGVFESKDLKPIKGDAAFRLSMWLIRGAITSGFLFRAVEGDRATDRPLTDKEITRIVQDRAKLAGLTEHFSPHSLRSGFVTSAFDQGVPPHLGMEMTGHKSLKVYSSYNRPSTRSSSRAETLLEQSDTADHGEVP